MSHIRRSKVERRLKAVIIGGGMIADVHRRAACLAGADVIGVLGSSPEASSTLAARWNLRTGFTSFQDVLISEADVVHVCTPNLTHAPYTLSLLAAGKHVVCEKPLGLDAGQAQAMQAAAAEAGLIATVPFIYRYHPLVREIRARRLAGEFGEWNLLHGSYLQDWMLSPSASGWRVDENTGGRSRAFADIGSHWCDLVEWVTGENIAEVSAQTSIAVSERPATNGATFSAQSVFSPGITPMVTTTTEDIATVLFRTSGDVPGSVTISQVAAGRKNRLWFEADGSKASAVFDQENPETVWIGRESAATVLSRDPQFASEDALRVTTYPAGHAQGWAQCFEHFVIDTYRSIFGDIVEGLPTFADGARSATLVDAVLKSAATRSWVNVQRNYPTKDGNNE